jgi:hypothetical protein
MAGRPWIDAVLAAGATAASFVPNAGGGSSDSSRVLDTELVEGTALETFPVDESRWRPSSTSFLDGFQDWRVVAYDRVVPILRGWVAAAVRQRGPDRRPRTIYEAGREVVVTFPERLSPAVRAALESAGAPISAIAADRWGTPAAALTAARATLERERVRVEREVGTLWSQKAAADEWLVVDGVLSEHAALASHPRTIGVVKSPGAQYFDGADQERALTLPAGHRSSVFCPEPRAAGAVYSWYLRLWPWEGRDLLHGLVRVEKRAHADTVAQAAAICGWLLAERAPLAAPDARWDRLLYPLHDVETYLRARAPGDLPVRRA